jgi:hypothetical protein
MIAAGRADVSADRWSKRRSAVVIGGVSLIVWCSLIYLFVR